MDRDGMREYIQRYRKRRRDEAIERLGGACTRCGSTEDLHFDHIDASTKVREIASLLTASKAMFEAELTKCQLLCRPCHLEKTRASGDVRMQPELRHGENTTLYFNYGCRCEPCKAYMSQRRKSFPSRQPKGEG